MISKKEVLKEEKGKNVSKKMKKMFDPKTDIIPQAEKFKSFMKNKKLS